MTLFIAEDMLQSLTLKMVYGTKSDLLCTWGFKSNRVGII